MCLHAMTRGVAALLPVAAVLWAVLIAVAPWADKMPGPVPKLLGAATYLTGATVCHQRPDRSFHTHGVQWPVCGRCSGLYLSAAAGVLLAWLLRRGISTVPFHAWRGILLAAAVPTVLTLVLEWWEAGWSSTLVRAVAAAPLGTAIGVLLTASMSFRGRLGRCERTQSSV